MLQSSGAGERMNAGFFSISSLDANMCLLDASEGQILFLNLVCCSMSFYWEIDTTGVRVINEQCFLIPVILLLGCGFFLPLLI